jgi:hypothetical protein
LRNKERLNLLSRFFKCGPQHALRFFTEGHSGFMGCF